ALGSIGEGRGSSRSGVSAVAAALRPVHEALLSPGRSSSQQGPHARVQAFHRDGALEQDAATRPNQILSRSQVHEFHDAVSERGRQHEGAGNRVGVELLNGMRLWKKVFPLAWLAIKK